MPQWYYTTVNMYDLREQGITAPQEIAYGFGIAMCYIDELIRRGLDIDAFAPDLPFMSPAIWKTKWLNGRRNWTKAKSWWSA